MLSLVIRLRVEVGLISIVWERAVSFNLSGSPKTTDRPTNLNAALVDFPITHSLEKPNPAQPLGFGGHFFRSLWTLAVGQKPGRGLGLQKLADKHGSLARTPPHPRPSQNYLSLGQVNR